MKFTLFATLVVGLWFTCAWGQKTPAPVGTGGTSTGGAGTGTSSGTLPGTSGTSNNAPATVTQPAPAQNPMAPSPQFPYFGTVVTDDGSQLPLNVNIQAVCGTNRRTVAHPSSHGDFSFELGSSIGMFEDAASSDIGGFPGGSSFRVNGATDCEIRADAAGYDSSSISLFGRSVTDGPNIGTVTLHRMGEDEGHTVSALSLKAPKDAKKNFDKGTEQARSKKTAEAIVSFQKAVAAYPQYADAWYGLGMAQEQTGSKDDARASFQKAMDLDGKLVGPWQELGFLASDQGKWDDAARYLDRAVKLDPVRSPMAWYFCAMANFNLGRLDVAERSLRVEMRLDGGKNPHAQYLLGAVLLAKKDFAGGAGAFRAFLATAPNGPEADSARQQLSRAESGLHK